MNLNEISRLDTKSLLELKQRVEFVLQTRTKGSCKEDVISIQATPFLIYFYKTIIDALGNFSGQRWPDTPATLQNRNPGAYNTLCEVAKSVDNELEFLSKKNKEVAQLDCRLGFYRLFVWTAVKYLREKGIPVSMKTILNQSEYFNQRIQRELPMIFEPEMAAIILKNANNLTLKGK